MNWLRWSRIPGGRASEAELEAYRRQKKEHNLSLQFVLLTKELRQRLNQTGHPAQRLFQVGDGSFCNRKAFREDWQAHNVSLIVRCRKDIVLCERAAGKGPRFYGKANFTPEQVRRRNSRAIWQTALIMVGAAAD